MQALIVYAHPEPASFNASMRDAAADVLTRAGHEVVISDLYASGFSPVAGPADFLNRSNALFLDYLAEQRNAHATNGFTADISAEQARVAAADLLIFQFPIWWRSMPAILKGWVDRVLAAGFAFGRGQVYASGPLRGKTALISATSGGPLPGTEEEEWLRHIGDGVLAYTGMKVLPPFIAGGAQGCGPDERVALLKAYRERIAGLEGELAGDVSRLSA